MRNLLIIQLWKSFFFRYVTVKKRVSCRNEQKVGRNFFHVSILSTTRNGFSLFSSCQREFVFQSCRNEKSARKEKFPPNLKFFSGNCQLCKSQAVGEKLSSFASRFNVKFSVRKPLFNHALSLFLSFFGVPPNDRGYERFGILREHSLSRRDKSECGT